MKHTFFLLIIGALVTACARGGMPDTPPSADMPSTDYPTVEAGCMVGGCSSELCVEAGTDAISPCIWKPEFTCYQSAICRKQASGLCAWERTPELEVCLSQAGAETF
jgi:hypothetical protein